MDKVVREETMNFFFKPTTALLQQYGRYANSDEVAAFQRRFDDLKAELTLAFDSGEAVVSSCLNFKVSGGKVCLTTYRYSGRARGKAALRFMLCNECSTERQFCEQLDTTPLAS